jgi:hypothetical protein
MYFSFEILANLPVILCADHMPEFLRQRVLKRGCLLPDRCSGCELSYLTLRIVAQAGFVSTFDYFVSELSSTLSDQGRYRV